MPRRHRTGTAGLIFHVINRGAKRAALFDVEADYVAFENLLVDGVQRVQISLLAYCLMPNHWHLVLRPARDADLPKLMHFTTFTHAQRWNAYRGMTGNGAVYQGRYKAIPVQDGEHFLRLCRYVERNPLRAKLVDDPKAWRWCSYWRRRFGPNDGLLERWPEPEPANWRDLLMAEPSEGDSDRIRTSIATNLPFGEEAWRSETAARLGLGGRKRGRPRKPAFEKSTRPLF